MRIKKALNTKKENDFHADLPQSLSWFTSGYAFKLFAQIALIFSVICFTAHAEPLFPFGEMAGMEDASAPVSIVIAMTLLMLIPSILIMMTGFTRIIIVLSFIRNALGLQQMPPNQVLIGISLFLTFFVMSPVIGEINETAYKPYTENTITQQEALKNAEKPLREFMLKQTYGKDLNLFLELAKKDAPSTYDEIETRIIVPAFILSELKKAFQMGFFILIPFIVIDMIVSSTLMSMGMMMLPPTMISLPFKVLLFVLVDGWGLSIKTLISSFQ